MKTSNVVSFLWKYCIANVVKQVMVLMKYHLTIIWKKILLTKNIWYYKIIFSLTAQLDYAFPKAIVHECQRSCKFEYLYNSFVYNMSSLKLSFMSAKNCVHLNIFTVALFIICQATQCIVLSVQHFYLRRNKGLFFCQQGIKGFP